MPRLFISCVSNEFASYRDAIRKDLSGPNLDTKIQEDFIAYGGATMEKLDDYIKACDAVIHFCGDMTGSPANELSVQYINKTYQHFAERFPALKPVLDSKADLSYTQWEAYLAIWHGKRLFVVSPSATAIRDSKYLQETEQVKNQLSHLNELRSLGYYDEIKFNTEDDLVKKLYQSKLGEILHAIPAIKPNNLPYHSIENNFKGREEFIKDLYATKPGITGCIAGIAIHGLGGIGKTRLVVEYAWQHKEGYTALLFIDAGSPETLQTNIGNLCDPVILNLPEHITTDEKVKLAAVLNWLNQYKGWLLILDNVDSKEAATKVIALFAQLQQGHVFITTRLDKWSSQFKKKPLGVLQKEDAISFLLETTHEERQKTGNDDELAAEIADELGCLALALEQARAYIITGELSFAAYRKTWASNREEVLSWFDEQLMEYPASVAITWQTTFDRLSEDAKTLLNRLAWLAPDPIPKSLLEIAVPDAPAIDTISAWQELKQYSLATSNEAKTAFSIHRLVQDVARNKLDKIAAGLVLNEALAWINIAFNGVPSNVDHWPVLEPFMPHVIYLVDNAEKNLVADSSVTRLMNDAATLFFTKAQFNLAELLMRRALAIDEQIFGTDHTRVSIDLNNLAQLLKDTHRLQEAEPLMRRALEIDEKSFGPNHPNVAIRLNNLATLLKATNRLQEAEPLMRRALEIDEKSFGPNHPDVAIDVNNLAQLLKATNRLQEAEPLMRRALEIGEKSFGPNHPKVAIRLNNLAVLLQDTNRLQEAEPLMRRVLSIFEQSFGSEHPNVAVSLNNLATLLKATNRLQEAEPLMRRALEIDEKSFGPNHPNVATSLNNLATLLKATNRLPEAEPLMRRSLKILQDSFETNHPWLKGGRNNYIILLNEMGKSGEEIEKILANL